MMKNILIFTAVILSAASVSAATLAKWTFADDDLKGFVCNKEQIKYETGSEKTPDGVPSLMLTVVANSKKNVAHEVQASFVSPLDIRKGVKYKYSFYIKASKACTIPAGCIQASSPWKNLAPTFTYRIPADWTKIERTFTADMEFKGKVRLPFFMLGKLPVGTKINLGPVTVEKEDTVLPLALNPQWTLFPGKFKSYVLKSVKKVPQTIDGTAGETVALTDDKIDLKKIAPEIFGANACAVLFNEFDVPEDGIMQIGCAADWKFEFYINGKHVYDTEGTGNGSKEYKPADHVFNFPVKKGKNIVAVKAYSGSLGWTFVCGKVPFRDNTQKLYVIRQGKEWRPLKMNRINWKGAEIYRISQFDIVKDSALDLSQYIPQYNVDECGRLTSNARGELCFENRPDLPVRLRGFNFIIPNWDAGFYRMTKEEIELFADELRRSGMNFVRMHFLDQALGGRSGYPKAAKAVAIKDLAQSTDTLPIDKNFADRYFYLLKCLRDRGIYVMLDIISYRPMLSDATECKGNWYGRFEIFDNPTVQAHWKAALEYNLKTVNPYTGKALIDDPMLLGITFYNEQEHLFNLKGSYLKNFNAEWQKSRGGNAAEFSGDLLNAEGEEADAARAFIRRKIDGMNKFYISAVRELGFKGFITQWDMFMRNMEGEARKDMNAVSMHTYHAHPEVRKVPPNILKAMTKPARWRSGGWKGMMLCSGRSSSIENGNYIARAAVTRIPGKPFFMTEYSHSGQNRYTHEAGAMWAAYASLQNWSVLAPHANTANIFYRPFMLGFEGASNPNAKVSSLLTCFGWQRGDIQKARHTVSFNVGEDILKGANYTATLSNGYNDLTMLTGVGTDYTGSDNSFADINVKPNAFGKGHSMGLWVLVLEENETGLAVLRKQVDMLRQKGILSKDNITDVDKGIFQSETGEITANVNEQSLLVNAPKFQSVTLKKTVKPIELRDLTVDKITEPCTLAVISLDKSNDIRKSKRLLLVIATHMLAENAVFTNDSREAEVSSGDMQLMIRSGNFDFSVKTDNADVPKLYALNMNGTRECEIPVKLENGRVKISLDTSKLKYGTPYFEIVF